MICALLVDDHDMVRSALASVLATNPAIQVDQAARADEAWEWLRTHEVDVVVCDLDMPGESGKQFALRLLNDKPSQAILILSYRVEPAEIQLLVEAGVRGYVTKSAPAAELLVAVVNVAQGQHYFSPQAASALADSVRNRRGEPLNPLTVRQTLILQQMANGKTTKEIASEMGLSPKTVEKYRGEIFRRFDCKNLVQALDKGRQLQLLDPPMKALS